MCPGIKAQTFMRTDVFDAESKSDSGNPASVLLYCSWSTSPEHFFDNKDCIKAAIRGSIVLSVATMRSTDFQELNFTKVPYTSIANLHVGKATPEIYNEAKRQFLSLILGSSSSISIAFPFSTLLCYRPL